VPIAELQRSRYLQRGGGGVQVRRAVAWGLVRTAQGPKVPRQLWSGIEPRHVSRRDLLLRLWVFWSCMWREIVPWQLRGQRNLQLNDGSVPLQLGMGREGMRRANVSHWHATSGVSRGREQELDHLREATIASMLWAWGMRRRQVPLPNAIHWTRLFPEGALD